jgi:hypothetical protein
MHPWPHRDGTGPGIVEGGPHRGAPAIVARAARAIVLCFPLPLPLLVPLPLLLGVGQEWEGPREDTTGLATVGVEVAAAAEDTLLLRHGVEHGGLSLGHQVIQLNLLKFKVITDGVEGGEWLQPLDEDLHVIEPLVQAL